jgi:galactitol-specific phosphotransferase system IIB component
MSCSIEPTDKKEFGIDVYKYLRKTYGAKDYYEVVEIKNTVKYLDYPVSWECWALVAFMLPANVGEYFRSKGTPMDVVQMKKEFINTMTDGKRDTLSLPRDVNYEYDVEPSEIVKVLTHRSLTNYFAARAGYRIGRGLFSDLMGI